MSTISSTIPTVERMDPADMQTLQDSVNNITTVLGKYGVTLSAQARKSVPKLGVRRYGVVSDTCGYMEDYPQFVPPFVSMADYLAVVADFNALRALMQPLNLAVGVLRDMVTLTGAEAYSTTLSCYNSVKQAAKTGEYNAEKIYAALSPYFPGRATKLATAVSKAVNEASKVAAAA